MREGFGCDGPLDANCLETTAQAYERLCDQLVLVGVVRLVNRRYMEGLEPLDKLLEMLLPGPVDPPEARVSP